MYKKIETHAELAVQDTGIGIPSEEVPLLGKRFHRVQTPGGRSHEGTGIGTCAVPSRRIPPLTPPKR
jgi:signal transduction histidine kinase